jgi:hypothetical protein
MNEQVIPVPDCGPREDLVMMKKSRFLWDREMVVVPESVAVIGGAKGE